MGGFSSMVAPSTVVTNQVVQPRTIQAMNPEQSGDGFERVKNKQKGLPVIATEVYNDNEIEVLRNPYEDDKELDKKLQKTVFSVDNKEVAKLDLGYKELSKKVDKEIEEKPKKSKRQKDIE